MQRVGVQALPAFHSEFDAAGAMGATFGVNLGGTVTVKAVGKIATALAKKWTSYTAAGRRSCRGFR